MGLEPVSLALQAPHCTTELQSMSTRAKILKNTGWRETERLMTMITRLSVIIKPLISFIKGEFRREDDGRLNKSRL